MHLRMLIKYLSYCWWQRCALWQAKHIWWQFFSSVKNAPFSLKKYIYIQRKTKIYWPVKKIQQQCSFSFLAEATWFWFKTSWYFKSIMPCTLPRCPGRLEVNQPRCHRSSTILQLGQILFYCSHPSFYAKSTKSLLLKYFFKINNLVFNIL